MSQPNRLAAVFLTTAAVLIATVIVMFGVGRATLALGRSVVRHEAIIRDLDESLSVLEDAETGQRGYLLTGDDTYLEPYSRALSHVDKEMNDLRSLARSGDLPAAQVDEIVSLADRKLKELAHTIELRRGKGFDQAVGVVRTDVGKRTMEAIRARVEALRGDQQEALDTAQWKADRATSLRSAVFAAGGSSTSACSPGRTGGCGTRRPAGRRRRRRRGGRRSFWPPRLPASATPSSSPTSRPA